MDSISKSGNLKIWRPIVVVGQDHKYKTGIILHFWDLISGNCEPDILINIEHLVLEYNNLGNSELEKLMDVIGVNDNILICDLVPVPYKPDLLEDVKILQTYLDNNGIITHFDIRISNFPVY